MTPSMLANAGKFAGSTKSEGEVEQRHGQDPVPMMAESTRDGRAVGLLRSPSRSRYGESIGVQISTHITQER